MCCFQPEFSLEGGLFQNNHGKSFKKRKRKTLQQRIIDSVEIFKQDLSLCSREGAAFNSLQIPRQKYADRSFPAWRFKLILAIVMFLYDSISINVGVSMKRVGTR